MAFVDRENRVLVVKVVYYGPERSGKTTNLEHIYRVHKHRIPTKKVMVKSYGDKTLFFDFLPLELGKLRNYQVKIQFYTVPGKVKYNATRRVVLKGVDGIVFVADSMVVRRKNNILSLKDLHENLAVHKRDIAKIPIVFQYNKRDLEEKGIPLLSPDTLDKDLNNTIHAPSFQASALEGINVLSTMKRIIVLTIARLEKELNMS